LRFYFSCPQDSHAPLAFQIYLLIMCMWKVTKIWKTPFACWLADEKPVSHAVKPEWHVAKCDCFVTMVVSSPMIVSLQWNMSPFELCGHLGSVLYQLQILNKHKQLMHKTDINAHNSPKQHLQKMVFFTCKTFHSSKRDKSTSSLNKSTALNFNLFQRHWLSTCQTNWFIFLSRHGKTARVRQPHCWH
jgi:hypothetical protein